MTSYRITFTDWAAPRDKYPRGKRVVVGTIEARNGLTAIRDLLKQRLPDEAAAIDDAWTGGSRKYLTLAGITFEASKL